MFQGITHLPCSICHYLKFQLCSFQSCQVTPSCSNTCSPLALCQVLPSKIFPLDPYWYNSFSPPFCALLLSPSPYSPFSAPCFLPPPQPPHFLPSLHPPPHSAPHPLTLSVHPKFPSTQFPTVPEYSPAAAQVHVSQDWVKNSLQPLLQTFFVFCIVPCKHNSVDKWASSKRTSLPAKGTERRQAYTVCQFSTAEHCCICIPGCACVERCVACIWGPFEPLLETPTKPFGAQMPGG